MVKQTLRSILWLSVVALGVLAQPSLHAQLPANAVPVKTYTGFFNDMAVYFSAFETNSSNFASANGLVYAPRLSNSNGAGVANMIFFQNGASGQTVVLQTQPGQPDYSPIWHVLVAAWPSGKAVPLITSYNAALQWWRSGQLLLQSTGIVFNGPVIVINRQIGTVDTGNLAPTLSRNEFLGLNPATRTAYFVGHQGYAGGQIVTFLALEHAPGEINEAPGAIPVSTIDLNHLGHAAIANFFEVPGQLPVLDSYPAQMATNPGNPYTPPGMVYGGGAGTAGKPGNLPPPQGTGQTGQQPTGGTSGQNPSAYGTPPGTAGQQSVEGAYGTQATNQLPTYSLPPYGQYSPIWHVHPVTLTTGGTGQPLTSLQGLAAALSSGLAVQADGGAQDTFNCPIVAIGQAYAPPGNPYPGGTTGTTTGTTTGSTTGTTGNPVYTPPGNTGGTTGTTGGTTTGTTGYTPPGGTTGGTTGGY